MRKLLFALLLLSFSGEIFSQGNTYYSINGAAANSLSSWTLNANGTGANPTDFAQGDRFIIQAGHTLRTTGTWGFISADPANTNLYTILQIDGTLIGKNSIANGLDSFVVSANGVYIDSTGSGTNLGRMFSGPALNGGGVSNIGTVNIIRTISSLNVALTLYNLILNANLTTTNNSSLNISNDLTINSSNSLTVTGSNLTVNRNVLIDNNGSLTTGTSLTVSGSLTLNNNVLLTTNGSINAGSTTLGNGASINTGGNLLTANSLTVNSGATISTMPNTSLSNSLTIGANAILNMSTSSLSSSGTFTTTGSGTLKTLNTSSNPIPSTTTWAFPVEFASNSSQSIPSGNYYKLINSGSGTHSTTGNINITGFLTVNAGTFTINNIVTLKSTSISNTAQVDQVAGTITYGNSGSVTVERFIPSGNRSYRDLGSVVYNSSSTIFSNWQEGGSTNANYGTHITGKTGTAGVDATTGFDKTGSGSASMYYFVDGNWNNISASTGTKGITLDPYQGYRVFIRGDRTLNLFQNPQPTTMNAATTLRTSGKLITGSVTYSTSGVTSSNFSSSFHLNNADNSGYSIVANPFQSVIDWSTVTKTNVTGTYWYFDPTISTNGAYVTWNGTTNSNGASAVNQYIQPGEAFFIQGNGSGSPSLTIKESDKVTSASLTSIFGTTPTIPLNKLGFTLWRVYNNQLKPMDGTTALFSANYSNGVLQKEDADKFYNSGENIALYDNNNPLSIDCRLPVTASDTLNVRFWSPLTNTDYTLRIDATNFYYSQTVQPMLLDKYTNTKIPLKAKDTLNYSFKATTDSATYLNRFAIVFSKKNVSSFSITPIATLQKKDIAVKFTSIGEYDLTNYVLEKSTDSINYQTVTNFTANNSGEVASNYTWNDINPDLVSKIYYRVKAYNIFDQQVLVSSVVSVDLSSLESNANVYPNPISGNQFNLITTYLPTGDYTIDIFNNNSNKVFNKTINLGSKLENTSVINLNNYLAPGVYILKITSVTNQKNLIVRMVKQP